MSVYRNKLLRINLSKREATEESIENSVIKDFVGGRGFGIEYLYRELRPGIDPLSPDNILLLVPGILGGTMPLGSHGGWP